MAGPPPAIEGARELAGKTLVMFDDGLVNEDGHWFEYDRSTAELNAACGVRVHILANAAFASDRDLGGVARVLPVIPYSTWTHQIPETNRFLKRILALPGVGPAAEWMFHKRMAAAFAKPLRRALQQEGTVDMVFHPSALAADLLAWTMIPRSLRKKVGRIALVTRFGLGTYGSSGPPRFARKLGYWKAIAWLLRREVREGRLVLLTDSTRLADEYQIVAGIRPQVICSPRTAAPATVDAMGDQDSPLFATLGFARVEKGVDLFSSAIASLIDRGEIGQARFRIQWNRPVPLPGGGEFGRPPVLVASPQVEFLDHALSSNEYEAMLHATDCMVLPYRRSLYHSQISGVAVEAACAGIPMIYTADTWLDDFVAEQGAGIAVPDGDVAALAAAIVAMRDNYAAYKALAVERSRIARARNSPQAFLQTLWNLPAAAARAAQ